MARWIDHKGITSQYDLTYSHNDAPTLVLVSVPVDWKSKDVNRAETRDAPALTTSSLKKLSSATSRWVQITCKQINLPSPVYPQQTSFHYSDRGNRTHIFWLIDTSNNLKHKLIFDKEKYIGVVVNTAMTKIVKIFLYTLPLKWPKEIKLYILERIQGCYLRKDSL